VQIAQAFHVGNRLDVENEDWHHLRTGLGHHAQAGNTPVDR
jgi:hypothetical protein